VTSNRHEPNPAELVDFEWERMLEPRWVEVPGTYIETLDADVGTWNAEGTTRVLLSSAAPSARYSPLKSEPSLFRKFAALPDTEDAFARFGEKYGCVPSIGKFLWGGELDGWEPPHSGDTLAAWSDERQMFARAVRLWDALRAGRPQDVIGTDVKAIPSQFARGDYEVHVLYPHSAEDSSFWLMASTAPRSSSPARIVQSALADMITVRSAARIVLAPSQTLDGSAGLRLTYAVDDLREALWLQLALAIDGNRRYETCPVCGEQWDATGARSDRETCSDRCRKRRNREAKES